jgi:hypothetical protein
MSAAADPLYSRKPFLLTLKGKVTVHYLDGQTLEGEIAAQDELNIWLTIDGAPHLIPRNQIRYIKGTPEQLIEPDIAEELPAPVPASTLDTSPGTFKAEPEPAPTPAQFVEEIEIQSLEEGGTLVIPPGLSIPLPEVNQTVTHAPVADEPADIGSTMVLSAEEWTTQTVEVPSAPTPVAEPGPTSTFVDEGGTELLPSLDLDEDLTFVLSQPDNADVSAHLICTTGPHAGEVLKLKPGITTIGRASDNVLPLNKDKEASRRHALIIYEASRFVVQDQNSLNGVFVNDQLIKEPRPLQDGDLILIGISTLKFQEKPKI